MKVCFVGLEITPSNGKDIFVGGTVNNVVRLSKGLTRHGHEVHIVTSDLNHRSKKDLQSPWGIIHSVPIYSPYASPMYAVEVATKLLYKALRIHSQQKFDVINIHTGYSALSIFAHILSLSTRIPIVFTLYSVAQEVGSFRGLYRRLSVLMESRFFLSRIEKIIAVSEEVKKALENKGVPSKKIVCIPPAVDLEQFNLYISKLEARKKLEIDSNIPLILYIGSWNPYKGVNTLVDGIKNVFGIFQEVKLILALGGVERDEREKIKILDKIHKMGFGSRVIELGVIRSVGELMAASDIIVVPYLTTYGIADRPLTVLEAMACGRPVIATNVGGIPEIIENEVNGILVNPSQPLEIEEALCSLLKDKKKSEMIGFNAARRVSQSHGINRVVTMLEKVYEELLWTH